MPRSGQVIKRKGFPVYRGPGVYYIVNLVNGKVYVGSALSIRGRLQQHRAYLRKGKHDNEHLQRAWYKYGESAFSFDLAQICPADQCRVLEQVWIDTLRATDRMCGYNICLIAGGGGMEGRTHSEAAKARMSETRKGRQPTAATEAAAVANRGRRRTDAIKQKIREGHLGKPKSEEHKAAIKAAHWTNRPDADEIRARMSEKKRDKKLSQAHKDAIRDTLAGREFTEEHKAALAEAHWSRRDDADEVAAKIAEGVATAHERRRGPI